jgi:hypothetical protein
MFDILTRVSVYARAGRIKQGELDFSKRWLAGWLYEWIVKLALYMKFMPGGADSGSMHIEILNVLNPEHWTSTYCWQSCLVFGAIGVAS